MAHFASAKKVMPEQHSHSRRGAALFLDNVFLCSCSRTVMQGSVGLLELTRAVVFINLETSVCVVTPISHRGVMYFR